MTHTHTPDSSRAITYVFSFDNQIIAVVIFRLTLTDNISFNRNNGPEGFPEEKCINTEDLRFISLNYTT